MNATNADVVGAGAAAVTGVSCARPANAKHAATSASNATAFDRLVMRCAKSPSRVPRTRSAVNTTTMDIAIGEAVLGGSAVTAATDSARTSEMAPVDAHVEIQSTHPTRKPA